ncbi:MAG: aromatic-ring-hydroxylating dioxygenase subunit beta [Halieaceae bacterium]|jgi:3-phenylpropionate/cinnamic acid dioxygenase small subunit|nr:aromatic-ring-hydroxylating dioxygenase subunit beta [Halieaceae bacterium]
MNSIAAITSPEQQRALEAFYYREARLLDNRQYRQWLQLVSQDVHYVLPARVNAQVDNRQHGSEDMISVECELEGAESMGCPIREESYMHLMLRVERAYKINSWSENPPARTRRLVGNVELMAKDRDDYAVVSNFHLYYARPGSECFIYSGQRRDLLRAAGDQFMLQRREVILDYADIELPTLGLLF